MTARRQDFQGILNIVLKPNSCIQLLCRIFQHSYCYTFVTHVSWRSGQCLQTKIWRKFLKEFIVNSKLYVCVVYVCESVQGIVQAGMCERHCVYTEIDGGKKLNASWLQAVRDCNYCTLYITVQHIIPATKTAAKLIDFMSKI